MMLCKWCLIKFYTVLLQDLLALYINIVSFRGALAPDILTRALSLDHPRGKEDPHKIGLRNRTSHVARPFTKVT